MSLSSRTAHRALRLLRARWVARQVGCPEAGPVLAKAGAGRATPGSVAERVARQRVEQLAIRCARRAWLLQKVQREGEDRYSASRASRTHRRIASR